MFDKKKQNMLGHLYSMLYLIVNEIIILLYWMVNL